MNIYDSIATRTNGNIYVGVVGPVRTGKSTFIARFMEQMVIPKMENNMKLARTLDELPQSGSGKQIMTMEPRFVPSDPVEVVLNKTRANIRLVDCVGYLIDGAMGAVDEFGNPRLVKTPWMNNPIEFSKASEIGTHKVIADHSTVAVLVTTDGSITDINRESYITAEERTVRELQELGKPFVILVNTITPDSENALKLQKAMREKYNATVLVKDVREMTESDFAEIFEKLLYEFPVKKIEFNLPEWVQSLDFENEIIQNIYNDIREVSISKMSDSGSYTKLFAQNEDIMNPELSLIDLATGEMKYEIKVSNSLFYRTLANLTGEEIVNDKELMSYVITASRAKKEYDKLSSAILKANETGYGVVAPQLSELELESPEVVKKGATNGLKLKAKAPSLHIMRVDVETEVVPAVGGGLLTGEIIEDGTIADNGNEIWNTSMFGKSMIEIAHDGIISKINGFPEEAEVKMRRTLSKITNEGKGGIICILL